MKRETEILLSAAFVLTPEKNWTRHYLARDQRGCFVEPTDARAVSWCLLGALDAAGDRHCPARFLHEAIGNSEHWCGALGAIAYFNNTHTHAEVLDALYRAAEIAEAS